MKTQLAKIQLGLTILAVGVCVVSQAHAQFAINVLNAQYSTSVMAEGTNGEPLNVSKAGNFSLWSGGTSRLTVSPIPISDEMYAPVSGLLSAEASAEMFQVSVYSRMATPEDSAAGARRATAGAESEIQFSPLTSGTATIQFNLFGNYEYMRSDGSLRLVDLTSSQTLWSYGWQGLINAFSPNPDGTATGMLSFETVFNAGDTYALDMYTQTFSDEDRELVWIQLSGLEVVPEPSVFALVGFGVAFFLALHRPRSVE